MSAENEQGATPETDALANDLRGDGWNTELVPVAKTLKSHAKLERQRDEARREAANLKHDMDKLFAANVECLADLAAARASGGAHQPEAGAAR